MPVAWSCGPHAQGSPASVHCHQIDEYPWTAHVSCSSFQGACQCLAHGDQALFAVINGILPRPRMAGMHAFLAPEAGHLFWPLWAWFTRLLSLSRSGWIAIHWVVPPAPSPKREACERTWRAAKVRVRAGIDFP